MPRAQSWGRDRQGSELLGPAPPGCPGPSNPHECGHTDTSAQSLPSIPLGATFSPALQNLSCFPFLTLNSPPPRSLPKLALWSRIVAYPKSGLFGFEMHGEQGGDLLTTAGRQSSFPRRCTCYLTMTSFIEHLLSARYLPHLNSQLSCKVQIIIIPIFQTRKLKFKESSGQSQATQLARLVEQTLEPRSRMGKAALLCKAQTH